MVALALPRGLELVGDDEADRQAEDDGANQDGESLFQRGRVLRRQGVSPDESVQLVIKITPLRRMSRKQANKMFGRVLAF